MEIPNSQFSFKGQIVKFLSQITIDDPLNMRDGSISDRNFNVLRFPFMASKRVNRVVFAGMHWPRLPRDLVKLSGNAGK